MPGVALAKRGRVPSVSQGYARRAAESAYPEFWAGLRGCWFPSLGTFGKNLRDVSGAGQHAVTRNTVAASFYGRSEWGVTWDLSATNNDAEVTFPDMASWSGVTMAVFYRRTATYWQFPLHLQHTGGEGFRIYRPNSGAQSEWGVDDGANDTSLSNTQVAANDFGWHWFCGTYDAGKQYAYYNVDGAVVDQGSVAFDWAGATGKFEIANRADGATAERGIYVGAWLWDRALPHEAVERLRHDFYAPFRLRRRRRVFVPAAGVAISCTTGAVTVAGLAAEVEQGTAIDCTTGTVTVTGLAAEVEQGTAIDCTTGTVTVTGLAAEVEKGTAIDCTTGTVTVTGLAASVSNEPSIDCTTGTVTVTGLAAEVEKGTAIDCTTGTVTVTGLTAEVEQGTRVACTTGAITVTGLAAEVGQGTGVACGVGALVAQALAAAVIVPIQCETGFVAVAGLSGSVQSSSNQKLNVSISSSRPGGSTVSVSRPGGVSLTVSRPGGVSLTVT